MTRNYQFAKSIYELVERTYCFRLAKQSFSSNNTIYSYQLICSMLTSSQQSKMTKKHWCTLLKFQYPKSRYKLLQSCKIFFVNKMSASASTISVFKSSVLEGSGLNKDNLSLVILKDSLNSLSQTKLLLNYVFSYWATNSSARYTIPSFFFN